MKNLIILMALMFATQLYSQGPSYIKMTCISVHDGDTFVAKDSVGNKYTVRPIGFDAPEVRSNIILQTQPFGRIAGDTLRNRIKGKPILVDTNAVKMNSHRDQYGRLLAECYFQDSSSIALFMVSSGMAWSTKTDDRQYPKMNTILKDAHRDARLLKIGLWKGWVDDKNKVHNPMSPWTWRKLKSIL